MDNAIALLRSIRDTAWQHERCHDKFSTIEKAAEIALEELGVVDGPAPNPRTKNWWVKSE
jgi:hypothetical protein